MTFSQPVSCRMQIVANPRLCRFSAKTPDWFDGEQPAHLTVDAAVTVGSTSVGTGTVYVTNKRVVFSGTSESIAFDYTSMVIHAVTSEDGRRCIFVQLLGNDADSQDGEEESEEVEDVIKIFPVNDADVPKMFEAMNEMSALNPDVTDDQVEYKDNADDDSEDDLDQ